jgi:lysine 6-dehydrogenase
MRYLLLGSGLQGTAIAWDLLFNSENTTQVTVCDINMNSLGALSEKIKDSRLHTLQADVADRDVILPLAKNADVMISAVNYWFNASLTEVAIEAGTHFLDLGGNNDIVAQQFAQNEMAKKAGVTIIPDCGLAPGLAGLIGWELSTRFDQCQEIHLRVGGLPLEPQPPMNYSIVFSVEGLINEYIEPAVVIRDGAVKTVPSMTELEELTFPAPFGKLEAFQTSGGISSLPETMLGKVTNLDYKTIRYPGHCAQVNLLMSLGLTNSEKIEVEGVEVSPRKVLANRLNENLPPVGKDVVLLQATATGLIDGKQQTHSLQIIDYADEKTDISAMMRMTGFPAAIIATMLAKGTIAPGAKPQELVIPVPELLDELRKRDVSITEDNH